MGALGAREEERVADLGGVLPGETCIEGRLAEVAPQLVDAGRGVRRTEGRLLVASAEEDPLQLEELILGRTGLGRLGIRLSLSARNPRNATRPHHTGQLFAEDSCAVGWG